jgi:ABC-2 type transport system permease protein
MSTATPVVPSASDVPAGGATFSRVVRSEWTKFWSLRSTMWTLLATFAVTVGFSALIAWGTSTNIDQLSPQDRANFDPTNNSLAGLAFGQLAIAVLGVMVISGEYSTGGIKATFTAVPQRMKVLLGKAVVLAVVSLAIGLVTSFAAFYVGQLFFARQHLEAHLGDPHVLRAVIGGGLYVLGSAMFGYALGALLRHTAGGITAAVALLLVIPPLTQLLPGSWGDTITKYFTSNAGQRITEVIRADTKFLTAWPGYAVFTIEWLIVLVVAAVLMRRRDA